MGLSGVIPPPPPRAGENGTGKKQGSRQGALSRGLPPVARGVVVVVESACLLVIPIGRLGRRGAGFVGVLNEVPTTTGHYFGPPVV